MTTSIKAKCKRLAHYVVVELYTSFRFFIKYKAMIMFKKFKIGVVSNPYYKSLFNKNILKCVILIYFLFLRTKYLPAIRELNVTKEKKIWVTEVLEKYLSCKYSKLPSEVFSQFITKRSTHGSALLKCLKGI